jgi:hypothetical protein
MGLHSSASVRLTSSRGSPATARAASTARCGCAPLPMATYTCPFTGGETSRMALAPSPAVLAFPRASSTRCVSGPDTSARFAAITAGCRRTATSGCGTMRSSLAR